LFFRRKNGDSDLAKAPKKAITCGGRRGSTTEMCLLERTMLFRVLIGSGPVVAGNARQQNCPLGGISGVIHPIVYGPRYPEDGCVTDGQHRCRGLARHFMPRESASPGSPATRARPQRTSYRPISLVKLEKGAALGTRYRTVPLDVEGAEAISEPLWNREVSVCVFSHEAVVHGRGPGGAAAGTIPRRSCRLAGGRRAAARRQPLAPAADREEFRMDVVRALRTAAYQQYGVFRAAHRLTEAGMSLPSDQLAGVALFLCQGLGSRQ